MSLEGALFAAARPSEADRHGTISDACSGLWALVPIVLQDQGTARAAGSGIDFDDDAVERERILGAAPAGKRCVRSKDSPVNVGRLGDSTIQLRSLESLAEAKNYNRWVADLALPYLGTDPLEVGSGLGYFAQGWLDSGIPRITVSELDTAGTVRLRSTSPTHPLICAGSRQSWP